jgi:hypothetical protein
MNKSFRSSISQETLKTSGCLNSCKTVLLSKINKNRLLVVSQFILYNAL